LGGKNASDFEHTVTALGGEVATASFEAISKSTFPSRRTVREQQQQQQQRMFLASSRATQQKRTSAGESQKI